MSADKQGKQAVEKMDRFFILEESILRLMGCPEAPSDPVGLLAQLLVHPTFFTPACISLDVTKFGVAATLTILQQHQLNLMYSAFMSKDREEWATFPLTPLSCYQECANVPEEMFGAAGNIGAYLDESELGKGSEQRRDGITYFVRIRGTRSKDLWLFDPESEDMPTHSAMLKSIHKISLATFAREPANSFLHRLFRGGRN